MQQQPDFQIKTKKVDFHTVPEKILINLNRCEKLFQEDKSEKLKLEIEGIKRAIEERQTLENDFYSALNLDELSKKKIFNFVSKEKPPNKPRFILYQDPVLGNIIKRDE